MKKLLLLLALWPSVALGAGPRYSYPTPPGLDDEVRNLYHDIANPVINNGIANSFTVTSLSVSTTTLISSATITNLSVTNLNGSAYMSPIAQIQNTYATQTTTGGSTFADSGLSQAITPSSASRRVKVSIVIPWQCNASSVQGDTDNEMQINIVRGSTQVWESGVLGTAFSAAITQNALGTLSASFIDSPATTSSVTYKVQFKRISASASTARVQANSETSVIILEDIP